MKFRIEGTFLRSKVARRVFFMFMLSAFVPATLLTVLTYGQVRSLEGEFSRRQLAREGGEFAETLYERLLNAHFVLTVYAAGLRDGVTVRDSSALNGLRVFRRIVLRVGDTQSVQTGASFQGSLPGIAPDLWAHLAKGESALLPQTATANSGPLMTSAVDPGRPDAGVLVAEINPDYLWTDADEMRGQTQACVLDAAEAVLFCSEAKFKTIATALMDDAGKAKAAGSHGGWLFDRRDLFLRARFAVDDWSIFAFSPAVAGVSPLARMGHAYLGLVALALLMVAFLSMSQIRRTLVPLERLIDGTRRIAKEEFNQPVLVDDHDEFGQLAQSLNSMAQRLGRQIGTMRALSEIDQEILSHVDMSQIIERVQLRLQELWPDAVTGVVVFDQHAADFGIVHLHAGDEGVTAKIPTRLEPSLVGRLARDYDGAWFDVGGADLPDFLSMLENSGAKRILVLPIFWRKKANGLLAIGLMEHKAFEEEMIGQARDLGNRVGVALAAQARDEELKYRAYHDDLTGLPNRALLLERMSQELAHARRNQKQCAVILLDLDRFKNINDSLGHESGNRLLCQVAERMTTCTREVDTVARLGGDEFAVLLPGLENAQQAVSLAIELLGLLSEPFMIDGSESFVGASIGVAIFPGDGAMPSELIKKADMAMYRAKSTGRGRVVFFEEGMNLAQQERAILERELRLAISRRQLAVHYQPRVTLDGSRVLAAEALIRWQHPELGWVSPDKFIPLAEELGLIDEIGQWVLHVVCEQMARWRASDCSIEAVSVNVSGRQFRSNKLLHQVRHALQSTGLPPDALEIELTEGTLVDNVEEVIEQLDQLKQLGVKIALDDFGTGYSSLAYLQRLPLDILKIDRSFIKDLGEDESAGSIVYAIITLAHALHMKTVAEGVESEQQVERLRAWGCEQIQGYYYSRPVTATGLEELLSHSGTAT